MDATGLADTPFYDDLNNTGPSTGGTWRRSVPRGTGIHTGRLNSLPAQPV